MAGELAHVVLCRSWKHPKATAYLLAFGDVATQQPRLVRCGCGQEPCRLRAVKEREPVPVR
jgi:hypothetical protein